MLFRGVEGTEGGPERWRIGREGDWEVGRWESESVGRELRTGTGSADECGGMEGGEGSETRRLEGSVWRRWLSVVEVCSIVVRVSRAGLCEPGRILSCWGIS